MNAVAQSECESFALIDPNYNTSIPKYVARQCSSGHSWSVVPEGAPWLSVVKRLDGEELTKNDAQAAAEEFSWMVFADFGRHLADKRLFPLRSWAAEKKRFEAQAA